PLSLPVGLPVAPTLGMSGDAKNEFMVAEVLGALIVVSAGCAWCTDQREPDGVIVRFVGPVLAIREDGGAKFAAHVGQIDPLVRRHFELFWLSRGPPDGADVPVIGRHAI